jgi:hypothetical protein
LAQTPDETVRPKDFCYEFFPSSYIELKDDDVLNSKISEVRSYLFSKSQDTQMQDDLKRYFSGLYLLSATEDES